MIILDTNIVSELLRPAPEPQVESWLAGREGTQVFLTAVTEAELRYGVALLPEGRRQAGLSLMLDSILREDFADRILPFDSPAAETFAVIASTRRASGRPIAQADCQIAAIARAVGASIATRNVKDFEGCGIEVINPWDLE
ncbi:type II toxin-antitoxin system VapC family toxin [Pseudogemmobacter sonorensis]|uniref:type II toxin-antitoxin system VapC family toxin n=1 Tax=Pseudogemmobacter sonorensis TaxID=2989681 RepID=UPI0036C88C95